VGRPARPALPAAGETSTAAAGAARQPSGVSGSRSGYRIPRLISPIRAGYFDNFLGSAGDAGRLHHQGPGDDPGQVLLQRPDGGRDGAVR
jgi:hypothetical protein